MTANGPITVFETRISELSIGDITLFNVRASINPAMPPPQILLGMSALKQIEFVQRGDSLTLIQHLE
jgi:aspartyl protease family protein